MVEGVVFLDLDGTVVDTMPALETLARLVVGPTFDPAVYRQTSGRPFEQQVQALFGREALSAEGGLEAADHAVEQFELRKADWISNAQPFSGALEAIQRLRRAGWWVYVVSSTTHEIVEETLKRIRIRETITGFAGYGPVGDKLAQLMYLNNGAELVRGPRYFVGDSFYDHERAKLARMRFIGVETTFARKDFLAKSILSVPTLNDAAWIIDNGG